MGPGLEIQKKRRQTGTGLYVYLKSDRLKTSIILNSKF